MDAKIYKCSRCKDTGSLGSHAGCHLDEPCLDCQPTDAEYAEMECYRETPDDIGIEGALRELGGAA